MQKTKPKKTTKGRVVYERIKHVIRAGDIARMAVHVIRDLPYPLDLRYFDDLKEKKRVNHDMEKLFNLTGWLLLYCNDVFARDYEYPDIKYLWAFTRTDLYYFFLYYYKPDITEVLIQNVMKQFLRLPF